MTTADSKPTALAVELERIAPELKAIARWVLWRYIPKPRGNTGVIHWAKVPFQASGNQAASTKPGTWATYDTVVDALIMGGDDGLPFDGLGFVFDGEDGIAGIDLDDCRDPVTGELNEMATEVLYRVAGYAEVSPSGTGLKIFTRAELARSRKDDSKGIELYRDGRYFTVTGHVLPDRVEVPDDAQDLTWFIEKHFGSKAAREVNTPADAFEMFRPPLSGWPLERVEQELLANLDPDMGYGAWVEVGMALHHQGRAESEWLTAWDTWSSGSGKYSEGECDSKWKSFSQQKFTGSGATTLSTLIWKVREANVNAAQATGAVVLDQKDFLGNARVVAERKYTGPEGLVLRHSSDVFFHHRGTHYAEMEGNTVRSLLWEFLDRARSTGRGGAIIPFKPQPTQVTGVADALKAITHLPIEVRPPLWLDGCKGPDPIDVVSLRNGLFHIPTRALLPHTSKFFTLNTLPFEFDCDAEAPNWEQFLSDVWGDDQEMIDTLQEALGYLIASDTSMQKMFMLIGPRRSGKGTIGRVINALIGKENISGPTLASLTTNFGLQPLIGKLVAIVSDARAPGRDHQTIVERLLMISGQDAITVDRKNMDAWVGEMTARVVVMSNEALQLGDSSGALVGRFVVLQMHRSFYGTEDTLLTNRLLGELPGIFNWALAGRERLYKRGFFVQPAGSAEAVEEMTKLNSPVSEFIETCCEVGHDFSESKDMVFTAYKKWCFKNDRKATNKVQFSKQLYSTSNQVTGMRPRTEDGGLMHVYSGMKLKDAVRARVQASMFEEDDDVFG